MFSADGEEIILDEFFSIFPAGELTTCIPINVVEDDKIALQANLTFPMNLTVVDPPVENPVPVTATLTIVDNDGKICINYH